MGLFNDLWWLSGFVLAAPVAVVGVDYLGRGDALLGGFFLLVALVALALPEYVRFRLFGSGSFLEHVPVLGWRLEGDGE